MFLLLALAACAPQNEDCVAWTTHADSCLAEAGERAEYRASVDCTNEPEVEAAHACMLESWLEADCSSPETIDLVDTNARACTEA